MFLSMDIPPNMSDYQAEYRTRSLSVPETFSFPLDICDLWGDRPALFWTDGVKERRFSFAEMKTLSSKGAGALKALGIHRGDKVLVMLPNVPEWWETMLALMRLNAIPIPATTLLSSKDIAYRLSATDIKAIIAGEESAAAIEEAVAAAAAAPALVGIRGLQTEPVSRPGWHDYLQARQSAVPFEGERAASSDPALIYFTSGTTGQPKMVLHTQASYPLAHVLTGTYWLDLRPGDVHWNLSDTGWAKAAWSSLFGPWHRGATVFSLYRKGKFDASFILEMLQKYPVTTFCGPPTAYRMMVKEVASAERFAFRSLRHCVAAGEPLNSEVLEIWKERTGRFIYDGYGQTETVNVVANFRCVPVKPGAMGLPVPGFVVDVIDDQGAPVPAGTEGAIALRTKPVRPAGLFKEYLGNPDATARTFLGQWYLTGDRAYKDEDGYFWFVGRQDDIILSAGYRIGPFEIESLLIEHPAVKEAAVVASPDALRGEVVKAFIVLTQGYSPSDGLAKELQEFVKKNTAPYKYPRKIEFAADLPKTVSGKIKRKELKLREFGA